MKITEEIFQVGGGGLTSMEDAAIYLINFAGHTALVDAGCGRVVKKLLDNIRALRVEPEGLEYLLITHCHFDHTGGVRALRDLLGCRTVAHELEAPFLEEGDNTVTAARWYGSVIKPFPVDLKLAGPRAEIPLGPKVIEAIHTPGHSPGSVVYAVESGGLKVVFAQDVHGPLHPDLRSHEGDYQRSLRVLLGLQADILCEGHYGVFRGRGEVEGFIRQFLEG